MASLVVMYKTPTDPKAFDKHYSETHISIAKRIPGLRKYEISQGPVMTPGGPSAYHMVATLRFNDMAAIQQAFASADGQAAVADARPAASTYSCSTTARREPRAHPQTSNSPAPYPASIGIRMV
jgi:uncharacterized protein (TIGR02118 family)